MIQLGYDLITEKAIIAEILLTGHLCCVGGTGSGKSLSTIYWTWQLKNNYSVKLYIADFKKSGDYAGITENYAEFEEVTGLIEEFYAEFEKTPENNPMLKILLIDEYAGYIVWLTQNDKKKAEEIKGKISNILMLGRSRHCFVWCVQQRISASLFPAGIGAIDNFQICIGLGRLSVESRKSLFAGEHIEDTDFEKDYHPKTGQGLVLIDGQELKPIQIPYISDKEKLKALLVKMARSSPVKEV
ncbi:MAG: hypothetical protein NC548_42270 [Lachnospiraceae bacterium]|nr:hypothetical protein [Lachnospiraceae bacterium]